MFCYEVSGVIACFDVHFQLDGFTCREPDETKPVKEKHEGKEKSFGGRRGHRYHPYKEKHGGEKKAAHRNRVFISNIPYDMKWQAIKDLMREKGNVGLGWRLNPSEAIDSFFEHFSSVV